MTEESDEADYRWPEISRPLVLTGQVPVVSRNPDPDEADPDEADPDEAEQPEQPDEAESD